MYKKVLLRHMARMSEDEFQKFKMTDEYRALNTDPSIREDLMAVFRKRRANTRKRETLLKALYSNPNVLQWIKEIENYRTLRIEQAWLSISIADGERDYSTKKMYEDLDIQRRTVHNKALTAFCKLVEKTSPLSNRSNVPQKDDVCFIAREEVRGDLYEGPLMIPYEEENKYGNSKVREAMTTGMFQFLKFIEETPRSDWDVTREKVIDSKKITIDAATKTPDIREIQTDLRRVPRQYGMSESPDKDDFSTDLYDSRDNKYTKKNIYGERE